MVPRPRAWQSIVQIEMVKIESFGTPQCRRFRRIRTTVLEAAAKLRLEIELKEINDSDLLSQSNPLELPRLNLNGELIASRNPQKNEYLIQQFQKVKK